MVLKNTLWKYYI